MSPSPREVDRSRVPQTVQIEPLDFYTAYELLGILDDNYATLAVQYADDALVSYASLELTAIPIPATLWLLGSSLLGLVHQCIFIANIIIEQAPCLEFRIVNKG